MREKAFVYARRMDAGRDPPGPPDEEVVSKHERSRDPQRPRTIAPWDPPDDGMMERLHRALFAAVATPAKSTPLIAGRYELGASIGRGAMGEVVRARDVKTGTSVAIKLLRRCDGCAGTAVERLRKEAKIIARLRHRNIIEIHEYGELPDGRKYIVMQYIAGKSLKSSLPGSPIDWRLARSILVQVADALAYAHANGVVHRDLSPGNVLLTQGDAAPVHCTVIDFGLARSIEESATGKLTSTGQLLGTPRFMSPEQTRGEPATPRSDIYALGCIAYEMLTGVPAAPGETLTDVLLQQQTRVPPPFTEVAPGVDVPRALEALVHRALRKSSDKRYVDMASFRDALIGFDEPPPAWSGRWMSFALRRLFAILLLLGVSATMLAFSRW